MDRAQASRFFSFPLPSVLCPFPSVLFLLPSALCPLSSALPAVTGTHRLLSTEAGRLPERNEPPRHVGCTGTFIDPLTTRGIERTPGIVGTLWIRSNNMAAGNQGHGRRDEGRDREKGGDGHGMREPLHSAGRNVQEGMEQVSRQLDEGYDSAREAMARGYRTAEGTIERNPFSSVMIGFGLGLGIGLGLDHVVHPSRGVVGREVHAGLVAAPSRFAPSDADARARSRHARGAPSHDRGTRSVDPRPPLGHRQCHAAPSERSTRRRVPS